MAFAENVLIEDDGNEALYLDAVDDHYLFTNAAGDQIDITLDGERAGPAFDDRHYGDWEMRHIAAKDGGGYTVLWAAENGAWNEWTLDEAGARLSYRVFGAEELSGFENQFQADLDGDGEALVLIEDDGNETLYLDAVDDHYLFTNAAGDQINIIRDGALVRPAYDQGQYGDWEIRQLAANANGGYTALWAAENGAWNEWTLDETGAFLSYRVFGAEELSGFEEQFQADLDGDGQALVLIEDDGNEALYLDAVDDHYLFTNAAGDQIDITLDGERAGPAFDDRHYGDWEMRHIAAKDGGGYTVLWAAENGAWNEWTLDEAGARLSYRVFGAEELSGFENQFQADLDGDGLF